MSALPDERVADELAREALSQQVAWTVGVVVPARDEVDHVGACVASLLASLDASERVGAAWIVVVADGCADGTADAARAALGCRGEVVEADVGAAGAARAIGVARLLVRWGDVPRERVWILNTDADTTVGSEWVDRQLALATPGVAAVAGIVEVDAFDDYPPGAAATFARTYDLLPDGTHPHVHGANLGVRADAYADVGGWLGLETGEDHCLWNRLRARGWPTLASTASVVTTSGRAIGRAPAGFAATLVRVLGAREDMEGRDEAAR